MYFYCIELWNKFKAMSLEIMRKITLEEIKNYFSVVDKMILSANYCVQNLNYYFESSPDIAVQKVKNMPYFKVSVQYSFFVATIELAKLFEKKSKNQHFAFSHFFKKLELSEFATCIEDRFDFNRNVETFELEGKRIPNLFLNKDEVLLEIERLGNLIEKNSNSLRSIKDYRDKVYAHFDRDLTKLNLSLSLADLRNATDLAVEIYNKVYGRLFDVDTKFTFPDAKLKGVIELISRNSRKN